MPELPEVEVVRVGLERHVVGATLDAVEVLHPRPVRRDPRGPTGFAAALTGRRVEAARRRGKYFWLALDNGDALLGHLGMSGQMLVAAGRRGRRAAPAGAVHPRRARPGHRAAVRRPADVRRADGLRRRRRAADRRSPTSPATRSTPSSTTDVFVRRVRQARLRRQAAAARPEPGLRRRQHLRRRGAVAGQDPRRAARRPADRHPGPRAARPGARGDGGGARRGRHLVRRALRQRQRRSPATSTARCTPTARRGGPATAAAPPSAGSPS